LCLHPGLKGRLEIADSVGFFETSCGGGS